MGRGACTHLRCSILEASQHRFRLSRTVRGAFWVYLLVPLGTLFTLGLLLPYAAWRHQCFRIGHSTFGQTPLTFSGSLREFYRAHGKGVLLALPFLLAACGLAIASILGDLLVLLAVIATAMSSGAAHEPGNSLSPDPVLLTLSIACFVLGALVPSIYVNTRLTNYTWKRTQVGPPPPRTRPPLRPMLWSALRLSSLLRHHPSASAFDPLGPGSRWPRLPDRAPAGARTRRHSGQRDRRAIANGWRPRGSAGRGARLGSRAMTKFEASYFDGRSSAARAVKRHDRQMRWSGSCGGS